MQVAELRKSYVKGAIWGLPNEKVTQIQYFVVLYILNL